MSGSTSGFDIASSWPGELVQVKRLRAGWTIILVFQRTFRLIVVLKGYIYYYSNFTFSFKPLFLSQEF